MTPHLTAHQAVQLIADTHALAIWFQTPTRPIWNTLAHGMERESRVDDCVVANVGEAIAKIGVYFKMLGCRSRSAAKMCKYNTYIVKLHLGAPRIPMRTSLSISIPRWQRQAHLTCCRLVGVDPEIRVTLHPPPFCTPLLYCCCCCAATFVQPDIKAG